MMRAIKFILALALVQAVAGREQQGLRATAGGDACIKKARETNPDACPDQTDDSNVNVRCQVEIKVKTKVCPCVPNGMNFKCTMGGAAAAGSLKSVEQGPGQEGCVKKGEGGVNVAIYVSPVRVGERGTREHNVANLCCAVWL